MSKSYAEAILLNLALMLSTNEIEGLSGEEVLQKAGFNGFDDFVNAMAVVAKKPSILMKRDVSDIWINNYCPNVLRAWNGNMDAQFVLDAYSCVMYILSYISKAEHELGELLKQARAQMQQEQGNTDLKKQMKQLGSVYLDNREVSVQEAVVRATGLPLKQCSRNTVFVATDQNPLRMSKPLIQIKIAATPDKDSDDKWMISLYDRQTIATY